VRPRTRPHPRIEKLKRFKERAMSNPSAAALRLNQAASDRTRWIQLAVGVICMIATANIQYAWTLFVPEIQQTYG
jgi:OFA family oxalate/formate antiporter-like MFS transporter